MVVSEMWHYCGRVGGRYLFQHDEKWPTLQVDYSERIIAQSRDGISSSIGL